MKEYTETKVMELLAIVAAGGFIAGMTFIVMLAKLRGWF